MRGSGSIAGASSYGTTSRTPRTSSRPPPCRASPDVIDVDAINDHVDAKPPARTTSAGRCLSVASAPTRPSRPLDRFEPPNYSQSAYARSSKGKEGPSKGGKGGLFPRGEFAGIAPSGRPVVSGGTTGLEVLEIALANWPVPEWTKGGTAPHMQPELCKLYSLPPPVDAEYFQERCFSPDWFDSDEDLVCYMGYDN